MYVENVSSAAIEPQLFLAAMLVAYLFKLPIEVRLLIYDYIWEEPDTYLNLDTEVASEALELKRGLLTFGAHPKTPVVYLCTILRLRHRLYPRSIPDYLSNVAIHLSNADRNIHDTLVRALAQLKEDGSPCKVELNINGNVHWLLREELKTAILETLESNRNLEIVLSAKHKWEDLQAEIGDGVISVGRYIMSDIPSSFYFPPSVVTERAVMENLEDSWMRWGPDMILERPLQM